MLTESIRRAVMVRWIRALWNQMCCPTLARVDATKSWVTNQSLCLCALGRKPELMHPVFSQSQLLFDQTRCFSLQWVVDPINRHASLNHPSFHQQEDPPWIFFFVSSLWVSEDIKSSIFYLCYNCTVILKGCIQISQEKNFFWLTSKVFCCAKFFKQQNRNRDKLISHWVVFATVFWHLLKAEFFSM